MVNEFRSRGIKVLSYFIGSGRYGVDREMEDFKKMYGGDSEFIDVTSVMSVSKTMNKKILTKVMITFIRKWLHNRKLDTPMCPCGWRMIPSTRNTLKVIGYVNLRNVLGLKTTSYRIRFWKS